MKDNTTTMQDIKDLVAQFIKDREWNQFHSPKNLSTNIALEAAELMEHFVWQTTEQSYNVAQEKRKEVEDELVDVIFAALAFANETQIDIVSALERKIAESAAKYPVEKVKGKNHKYTYYQK